MKTFCIRFILKDDFYTSKRVAAKGMKIKDAWGYAEKQLENNKDYIGIDDVYEVKSESIS